MKKVLRLLLLIFPFLFFGQSISGYIYDSNSNSPLEAANV